MEALYSKLYAKYTKLKANKNSEIEQLNVDQEEKFKSYASASDELIAYLTSEHDRLCAHISDLRQEVALIRSAKDEEQEKYEKMLMEETQKNKELSEEIERLHRKVHSNTSNDMLASKQVSGSSLSSGRTNNSAKRKRHQNFMHEKEAEAAPGIDGQHEHVLPAESEHALDKENTSSGPIYTPRRFRINAKNIFLTYPHCHLSKEDTLEHIIAISLPSNKKFIRIARELHEDGSPHLHVLIQLEGRAQITNQRLFDLFSPFISKTFHPNIQGAKSSSVKSYIEKDGDYKDWGEFQIDGRSARVGNQDLAAVYADALNSGDVIAALQLIREKDPKNYTLQFHNLSSNYKRIFTRLSTPYTPEFPKNTFKITDDMQQWLRDNLPSLCQTQGNTPTALPNRPKGLIIESKTRLGKTQWARSLGPHNYLWGHLDFNKRAYNNDALYNVIDDVAPNYLKMKHWKKLLVQCTNQPKCCRRRLGNSVNASDPTMCVFQELVESLVGLKFSIVAQTDDILITAVHESSASMVTEAASGDTVIRVKPPKPVQELLTCKSRRSRCFMKRIKCPLECPKLKPKNPKQKACFLDCLSPKCEAVCRSRKPNCNGPGAACYDPRFIGGDGIVFYFHGRSNEHFSLISDSDLQINARFIGLRPQGRTRDYTWIQALGIKFGHHNFTLEATKSEKWDDNVDHLKLWYDGMELVIPEGHSSEWNSTEGEIQVERTSATNSVTVSIPDHGEISVNVIPVSEEDSKIHNYQIPANDSFAHLEVQFRFLGLSSKVEGILGRTYRPDYKNPAKPGVAMPVVGGDDKYKTSSLLAMDCALCVFCPGKMKDGDGSAVTEYGMLDCTGGGNGIACKK